MYTLKIEKKKKKKKKKSCNKKNLLQKQWQGDALPKSEEVEKLEISAGQVVLIFIIMASVLGVSLLLFLCEIVHKKLRIMYRERQLRKWAKSRKPFSYVPPDLLKYPTPLDGNNKLYGPS